MGTWSLNKIPQMQLDGQSRERELWQLPCIAADIKEFMFVIIGFFEVCEEVLITW